MKVGAIDIGSNTIKLLVAQRFREEIHPILNSTIPVRLGEGTFETGILPTNGIHAGAKAVSDLCKEATNAGAQHIEIFATSAVRSASNAGEFQKLVKDLCGRDIHILSGEEEAALIFRGVSTDPVLRQKELIVVDVGGGSVEIICGQNRKITQKRSMEIGAVRLNTKFIPRFPAPKEAAEKIQTFITQALQQELGGWHISHRTPVATGGTIICLSHWTGQENPEKISIQQLQEILSEIAPMTHESLMNDPRIPTGRGEVLLAGTATYLAALRFFKQDHYIVSRRNLRYGLVDALLEGEFLNIVG